MTARTETRAFAGKLSSPVSAGLRTRYVPKSRIGQGLVSMAPWVDILLLVVFFLMLNSKLLLQPGVIVDLPAAPFVEGSSPVLVAVVLSVGETENSRPRRQIVFFDDERFLAGSAEQMARLKHAFAVRAGNDPDQDLVIEADRDVPHGLVIDIMNMALEVGIRRVNIAARPY